MYNFHSSVLYTGRAKGGGGRSVPRHQTPRFTMPKLYKRNDKKNYFTRLLTLNWSRQLETNN